MRLALRFLCVVTVFAAGGYLAMAEPDDAPKHPLVGKPAPQFNLDLLEGGKLDLAAQKEKTVVVLDFWATWCGPCRMALPSIIEVANAYKDKGVLVCGVDLLEPADRVTAFLKNKGYKFAVALDKDGAVSEKYGVRGIPTTVIIGKDGNIAAIHIGLIDDLKKELSAELDRLLAGKKLAGEITQASLK